MRASRAARRAARSRAAAWAVAAVVAVLVAVAVDRAGSARETWGASTEVLVAEVTLEVGDVVDDSVTRVEPRPEALVPADALDVVPDGARVVAPVMAGEVLVAGRVAAAGRGPTGARLGPDEGLLVVPVAAGTGWSDPTAAAPLVRAGDLVDLYGGDPGDVSGTTSAVARAAVAVSVDAGRVVLRTRRSDAAASAAAVLSGPTTMVVVG